MAPLIVLVTVTLLPRLAGRMVRRRFESGLPPLESAWRLCCVSRPRHTLTTRPDLVRMVPSSIPNPELMVTVTGICEILRAIGLLVPRTRRVAAVALILFLVAVLPAKSTLRVLN